MEVHSFTYVKDETFTNKLNPYLDICVVLCAMKSENCRFVNKVQPKDVTTCSNLLNQKGYFIIKL